MHVCGDDHYGIVVYRACLPTIAHLLIFGFIQSYLLIINHLVLGRFVAVPQAGTCNK
jgi:hypothetical protein